MTNKEIATTILQQMGGNRLVAMTGAKNFLAIERGLQFTLPSNFAKDGVNRVRVVLDPDDTYTVEFMRARGTSCKSIAKFDSTYCDQLQELFEDVTGLATHL